MAGSRVFLDGVGRSPRRVEGRVAQFVIHQHDSPWGVHWDLMLQQGDSLATWALQSEPSEAAPIEALRIADHRMAFLEYEGPISAGRGSVKRWDKGQLRIIECGTDRWTVHIEGLRLRGQIVLSRTGNDDQRWTFIFSPDPDAAPSSTGSVRPAR